MAGTISRVSRRTILKSSVWGTAMAALPLVSARADAAATGSPAMAPVVEAAMRPTPAPRASAPRRSATPSRPRSRRATGGP